MNLRDFSLILIVFLVPVICSVDDGFRIIGGRKVTTLEFPYQVSIELRGRHHCGGSIVEDYFILTAAHCVFNIAGRHEYVQKYLKVRVGSDHSTYGGKVYGVMDVIVHDMYDDLAEDDQYDIALLRLNKRLHYTERIGPVDLSDTTPKDGQMAWVSGYGRQEIMRSGRPTSRPLMAVELPIISLRQCQKKLYGVMDDMICAGFRSGHKDACIGDSGGPLVIDGTQVGIVAWGIGCGRSGYPGVYTNVAMYNNWIYENMDGFQGQRNATN